MKNEHVSLDYSAMDFTLSSDMFQVLDRWDKLAHRVEGTDQQGVALSTMLTIIEAVAAEKPITIRQALAEAEAEVAAAEKAAAERHAKREEDPAQQLAGDLFDMVSQHACDGHNHKSLLVGALSGLAAIHGHWWDSRTEEDALELASDWLSEEADLQRPD
jgi:hypothetical protein